MHSVTFVVRIKKYRGTKAQSLAVRLSPNIQASKLAVMKITDNVYSS